MLDELIRMFGPGNPRWLQELLGGHPEIADWARRWTGNGGALLGTPVPAGKLWHGAPEVSPVKHVFPVYCRHENRDLGLMVPLVVNPSEKKGWHVSDAFGRLSKFSGNPSGAVEAYLDRVEEEWSKCHHQPLLVHARCPLRLFIGCPVHMDAIEGASLQLPLLVALLRAAAETAGTLPWGERPVFCSGQVDDRSVFGDVEFLPAKVAGFQREYGTHCPLILTPSQADDLLREAPGLLENAPVLRAHNLSELLKLDELGDALRSLAERGPTLEEVPALAREAERLEGSRKCVAVIRLANWVLPHLEKYPALRFPFLHHKALAECHQGRYMEVANEFEEIRRLVLEGNRPDFGVNDRIRLAAGWTTEAFDSCDVSVPLSDLFSAVQREIPHASLNERARFHGAHSQFLRLSGKYREAANTARIAVECAAAADPLETGRDRNYLVHALLRQAAALPLDGRGELLAEAKSELAKSRHEDPIPRAGLGLHHAFCDYYEGELHRLEGLPWPSLLNGEHTGADSMCHPHAFCCISAARNTENNLEARIREAEKAADMANKLSGGKGLLLLFAKVFRVFARVLENGTTDKVSDVEEWLDCNPSSGWRHRLAEPLKLLESDPLKGAESLCDAIPHL